MPSDILKKLAALVEEARSGRCDDVKYGDNCGKCPYCLAWALDEDWVEQLQAPAASTPEQEEVAIWISPRRHGGDPCVMGTRVPTVFIAAMEARGPGEALKAYPDLSPEQIAAALWYESTLTPPKVEVCPHCGKDEGVCKYLGEHIAE